MVTDMKYESLLVHHWTGLFSTRLNSSMNQSMNDAVLDRLMSYLSNRSLSLRFGNSFSSQAVFFCGIHHGSILGPLLFRGANHVYHIDLHC